MPLPNVPVRGVAGKLFARGAKVAREWSHVQQSGMRPSLRLSLAHAVYEKLVYKRIRTIFGPNAQCAITGRRSNGCRTVPLL